VYKEGIFCDSRDKKRKWEQSGSIITDKAKRQINDLSKYNVSCSLSEHMEGTFVFEFSILLPRQDSWKLNRLINAIWKRIVPKK